MEVCMIRTTARFALFMCLLSISLPLAFSATEGSPYLHIESDAPEFTEIRWENPVYDVQSIEADGEVLSLVDVKG